LWLRNSGTLQVSQGICSKTMLVQIRGNLKMLKSQTIKGLAKVLMPALAAAVGGPGKPCFCRGRTEGIVDQVMELATSGAEE